MNKNRRKTIGEACEMVTNALELLASARELIEQCKDDEQDYFDNMPESLQGGDKGAAAESAVEKLEEALTAIDEFEGAGIVDCLESAAE